MFEAIRRDIRAAMERDPAARRALEVLFCYPGVHALWFYRLAHRFWRRQWVVTARFISHLGRFFTGIEIHPGATIGPGLFIDHGMLVDVAATTEIGENCTLYQGVTLGGTSLKREKRHPTLGNSVVVGAGAAILGAIKIDDGSRVGGGSVVVNDVPPNSVVVGVPGKVIYRDGKRVASKIDLEHTDLPDPVSKAIEQLVERIHGLESEVETLKKRLEKTRILPA